MRKRQILYAIIVYLRKIRIALNLNRKQKHQQSTYKMELLTLHPLFSRELCRAPLSRAANASRRQRRAHGSITDMQACWLTHLRFRAGPPEDLSNGCLSGPLDTTGVDYADAWIRRICFQKIRIEINIMKLNKFELNICNKLNVQ